MVDIYLQGSAWCLSINSSCCDFLYFYCYYYFNFYFIVMQMVWRTQMLVKVHKNPQKPKR